MIQIRMFQTRNEEAAVFPAAVTLRMDAWRRKPLGTFELSDFEFVSDFVHRASDLVSGNAFAPGRQQ
jgi:hypothetical protein